MLFLFKMQLSPFQDVLVLKVLKTWKKLFFVFWFILHFCCTPQTEQTSLYMCKRIHFCVNPNLWSSAKEVRTHNNKKKKQKNNNTEEAEHQPGKKCATPIPIPWNLAIFCTPNSLQFHLQITFKSVHYFL